MYCAVKLNFVRLSKAIQNPVSSARMLILIRSAVFTVALPNKTQDFANGCYIHAVTLTRQGINLYSYLDLLISKEQYWTKSIDNSDSGEPKLHIYLLLPVHAADCATKTDSNFEQHRRPSKTQKSLNMRSPFRGKNPSHTDEAEVVEPESTLPDFSGSRAVNTGDHRFHEDLFET